MYGKVHTLQITSSVTDASGNGLAAPFISTFTTAAEFVGGLSVYVLSGGDATTDQKIKTLLEDAGHTVSLGVSSVLWDGTQADLNDFDVVILQNNFNWADASRPECLD
jgi:hypothetical protein